MGKWDQSQPVKYLVPSILAIRQEGYQAQVEGLRLAGVLLFARKDALQDWRTRGYVTMREVVQDGFLPNGLFAQIIDRVVRECQSEYGQTVYSDNMWLSKGEVRVEFGRHKFVLRCSLVKFNLVELLVLVDHPLLIVERVFTLVGEAVKSAIPDLDFALAVRVQDGGRCSGSSKDQALPEEEFVLLDGKRGLEGRLEERGVLDMVVGKGQCLSCDQARERFSPWLQLSGLTMPFFRTDGWSWTAASPQRSSPGSLRRWSLRMLRAPYVSS